MKKKKREREREIDDRKETIVLTMNAFAGRFEFICWQTNTMLFASAVCAHRIIYKRINVLMAARRNRQLNSHSDKTLVVFDTQTRETVIV